MLTRPTTPNPATEHFANDRLNALAKSKGAVGSEVPEVLFVCVHNAGRSQMAAALLNVVRASDVVITMGCGDSCPIYPGKRYEDWELTDPAGQSLETVRAIRDQIHDRVRGLVSSLLQTRGCGKPGE